MAELSTEEDLIDYAFRMFAAYVEGNLIEDVVYEQVYAMLLEGITGATRQEILEVALAESIRMVDNILVGTQEGLAQLVADALDNQTGVDGLAQSIRDKIGLNSNQIKQANALEDSLSKQGLSPEAIAKAMEDFTAKATRERAELIANTEMRHAMSQGEKAVMANRGAKYKVAVSSQDSQVSDICEANEAAGPIPIDEPFPSGDDTPPFHPNCRCAVHFVTSDEQADRERERAEIRSERVAEAKGEEQD